MKQLLTHRLLPLTLTVVLLSLAARASEPVLTARAKTLSEIKTLLGVTEATGPTGLLAGVYVAKGILGERADDYSDYFAKREMYCIGYSLAGREDDLQYLLRNLGDDREEPFFGMAVNFLLIGGHERIASRVIDTPECAPYRTSILDSNYINAVMRDDRPAILFLRSMIPQYHIEQIEELNATKIGQAALARQFSSTCGAQWLLASPRDKSFVIDSREHSQSPTESAAVSVYDAIKARGAASADSLRLLEGRDDYRGLLELYRLRQLGCNRILGDLSLDVNSKYEFRARFAAMITCDTALAATSLSHVQEKYLSDAVFELSAHAQSTLDDQQIVTLSRHIETGKIRLFFLCCTLVN